MNKNIIEVYIPEFWGYLERLTLRELILNEYTIVKKMFKHFPAILFYESERAYPVVEMKLNERTNSKFMFDTYNCEMI